MRRIGATVIVSFLLISCSSAPIPQPNNSLTLNLTKTPLATDTVTPQPIAAILPTSTITITATGTPAFPSLVEIKVDPSLPQEEIDLVKTTVQQAYWFYVDLGCSPDAFFVQETQYESGEVTDVGHYLVGWDDFEGTTPYNRRIRISHETAHVMCQYALTKRSNTGADLRWLTEGAANYFSSMEQFRYMESGWGKNIQQEITEMGIWMRQNNLCQKSLANAERQDQLQYFPEFAGVGHVAAAYLAETSVNGTRSLIDYYGYLADMPTTDAFQQAFGLRKEDFYRQFQEECNQGFPSLQHPPTPTPDMSTQLGQGCVSESSSDESLSITCLGRMSGEALPPALQDKKIVYGFDVTGIDFSAYGFNLDKMVSRPKGFKLEVEGTRLFVIIPTTAQSGKYFVTITLNDGRFASALYNWQK